LVELTITTGLRSGEVRGLTWESIDLEGKRLFVERQASRRGEEAAKKTESSVRPNPPRALAFPRPMREASAARSTPTSCCAMSCGEHCAGQAYRHCASIICATWPALMHEAGVPLKRAQETLGHASERTTLAICTHAMRRTRDDSVDEIAELAGLKAGKQTGNKRLRRARRIGAK
jgi:integrase